MTWDSIFEDFQKNYICESGLCRLQPYPLDSIFLYGIETCENENGILFLAFTLVAAYESGNAEQKQKVLDLKPQVVATIERLQRLPKVPGFYNRQPLHNVRTEAHDNYAGIAALCALYDIQEPVNGMIRYAWRNWFCFNNVNPDKFALAQVRQPGEVALYYMTAKRRAPFLFALWFLVGLYISGRKKLDPGRTQLPWLRLWTIDRVKGPKGFIQRFLYTKVRAFWIRKLVAHYGSIDAVQQLYYKPYHPVNQFNNL